MMSRYRVFVGINMNKSGKGWARVGEGWLRRKQEGPVIKRDNASSEQIQAFLDAGGEIEVCPAEYVPRKIHKVGIPRSWRTTN